jgi:hypothetical protein
VDDSDEALRKYAEQVAHLIDLYRKCSRTGDRRDVQDFHYQMVVVEALTSVARMKVVRVDQPEGRK